jgi:serine/threonine protein kinase
MGIAAGEKIGPYEVISPLGAGGMGEVYRARDGRLGRQVAIKVVSRTLAKDPDRLRRFALEARTVAALNHPNILGIHDIGTHDGSPYLVSELLEGETLREKLVNGALPVRRAVEYALGIALGLAAAHDKGIIHRDLKPENVFITRDGRVKVLDFGLAKLVRPDPGQEMTLVSDRPDTAFTQPGVVVGTVGYMSPEQVRGEVSDGRSDIFSFGSVLYEMLTGKRAFKKDTTAETMTAILKEEPPELTETGWQGPLGLQKILSRCLEKNVERRFQSASDLAFAIESLSGTAVSQKLAQEKLQVKRAWWPWALAAAGMVLLAAGAWFAGKRSSVRRQPDLQKTALRSSTARNGKMNRLRSTRCGRSFRNRPSWICRRQAYWQFHRTAIWKCPWTQSITRTFSKAPWRKRRYPAGRRANR